VRCAIVLIATFVLSAVTQAADDVAAQSPTDLLQALAKEWDGRLTAFQKASAELKNDDERKAFNGKAYPQPEPLYPRFMALAKKYPQDPAAVDALTWIILHRSNDGGRWDKATWEAAEALLLRDHLASDRLPAAFEMADEEFLRAVMEKSPRRESQGLACFTLADKRRWKIRRIERWREENPDWQQVWKQLWFRRFPEEFASLVTADINQEIKEDEKLWERIARDFADLHNPESRKGRTMGADAKGHLHEIRDLGIGKTAPALTSVDLNGKPVRLGDLRGRVVVLDVWATWCGPCCAMIPHERELVKRLAGRPFELVSISVDEDRQTVIRFLEKEPMPWTHWFNGPDGLVIEELNVWSFPTIYVLDETGVIRYKDVRGEQLDRAIDKLLSTIERPAAK